MNEHMKNKSQWSDWLTLNYTVETISVELSFLSYMQTCWRTLFACWNDILCGEAAFLFICPALVVIVQIHIEPKSRFYRICEVCHGKWMVQLNCIHLYVVYALDWPSSPCTVILRADNKIGARHLFGNDWIGTVVIVTMAAVGVVAVAVTKSKCECVWMKRCYLTIVMILIWNILIRQFPLQTVILIWHDYYFLWMGLLSGHIKI